MKQLKNNSVFNEFQGEFYREYDYALQNGLIVPKTVELSKKKISKKYDTWIDKLDLLNPQEYTTESIETIAKEDLSELALLIVIKVFGENIITDFNDFIDIIDISGSNSLLDGIHLKQIEIESGKVVSEMVSLPNIEYLSSIVSMLHEFTHYYCNKYNVNFNKKRYYLEILSLYVEKYTISYLGKVSNDPNFKKKLISTRINNIIWHHKKKEQELNMVFNQFDKAKSSSVLYEAFKSELSEYYQTSYGRKIIKAYEQCLAHSYGIGYLFGDALYRKCLEDENLMRKKITEFMLGNKSIEDLLNYYNISLENFSIYDESYNDVKRLLR